MLYSFSGSVAVPQHKNAVEMKNDPHFWHLKQSGRMRRVLLCQLGNALVFGLQNHAAVIKILAKAGNCVSCCGNTAATHDFAVQYLVFNVLGKTHVWCSHSLYREIRDVSGRAAGIAVLHAGLVTKLCAVLPDLAGKSDRTVLAAGAANGDHQLAFALLNIQRQRIFQTWHTDLFAKTGWKHVPGFVR